MHGMASRSAAALTPTAAPSKPGPAAASTSGLRHRSTSTTAAAQPCGGARLLTYLAASSLAVSLQRRWWQRCRRSRCRLALFQSYSSDGAALPRAISTGALPGQNPFCPLVDVLRFDSNIYYVSEKVDSDTEVCVDVLRFGRLDGECSVHFHTEECSAKDGVRFESTSGDLFFGPGQSRQTLRVKILCDEGRWNPTLEFQIRLSKLQNCRLGGSLGLARVKVIDQNGFPSDAGKALSKKLQCETRADKAGFLSVTALKIFWEYFVFNFKYAEGMALRTVTAVFIDVLANLSFVAMTYALKYAADDVFGATPELPLLVQDSKEDTLLVLGVLYFLLFAIDLGLSNWRESLRVAETSQTLIEESIFTKFMNYSAQSKRKVSSGRVMLAMTEGVDEVVNHGYVKVIEFIRLLGKVTVSSYFIIQENADCEFALALYACVVTLFIAARYKEAADLSEKVSAETQLAEAVQEGVSKHGLVAAYFMRPQMIRNVRLRAETLAESDRKKSLSAVVNRSFPGGVSALLIGTYIYVGGDMVLKQHLEVGAFLTTIALLKDMSASIQEIFNCMLSIAKASGAASELAEIINYPTNLADWREREERRRAVTRELWINNELMGSPHTDDLEHYYPCDDVPLALENVSFSFTRPHLVEVLDNASISVDQGKLVGIIGDCWAGKTALLDLLGNVMGPTAGTVVMPSYLRILHVSMEPELLSGCLWKNLSMGRRYWTNYDQETKRVMRICRRLGFRKSLLQMLEETRQSFMENPEVADFSQVAWTQGLSHTDKVLIHVARAFVFNSEVLVMNRPAQDLSDGDAQNVIDMLKEFVRERGVELPAEGKATRRPRTAFVAFATVRRVQQADVVWHLSDAKLAEIPKHSVCDVVVC